MASVEFLEIADSEEAEALAYYESISPELGERFEAAAAAVIRRIAENPRLFPFVRRPLRSARFRKFPYAYVFRFDESDRVLIIACIHQRSRPRFRAIARRV